MLVLLTAFIVGVAGGYLSGGRLHNLADLDLSRGWLVLAALGLQIVAFSPARRRPRARPRPWPCTLVSYALLAWFVVLNRCRLGVVIAGVGMGLNLVAIAANGGYMPASRTALALAGIAYSGDTHNNSAVIGAGTHLSFLGDVFAVPVWMPAANVFSIGDLLIAVGGAACWPMSMRASSAVRRGPAAMNAIAPLRAQVGGYQHVLAIRDYRLLWSAQVVSTFGDRLTQIGLIALVFAMTGSDGSIGLVLTLTVLPRAVFGLFAGALADRVSRKTLLIATDCIRALIVLVLALAAGFPLGAVYVLAVLLATVTVFFAPTRNAVAPRHRRRTRAPDREHARRDDPERARPRRLPRGWRRDRRPGRTRRLRRRQRHVPGVGRADRAHDGARRCPVARPAQRRRPRRHRGERRSARPRRRAARDLG